MSAFSGPQGKGALAERRKQKRAEAEDRDRHTPGERRRWVRQIQAMDGETRAAIITARRGPERVARQYGISPEAVKAIWEQAELEACGLESYDAQPETGFVPGGHVSAKSAATGAAK